VVEATRNGRPQEDSYTELKADLPSDIERTSRQLVGHANSANGEPVLWVVGVQEDGRVIGAQKRELANWLPAVAKRFDGPAPRLSQCLAVPCQGKMVLGLLFLTDELPYVVCKADGSKEVPWREGNKTRQAGRTELVGLLGEFARLPEIDVMSTRVSLWGPLHRKCTCEVWASLYVKPRLGNQVTIPFHDCSGAVEVPGVARRAAFTTVRLYVDYEEDRSHKAKDIVIRRPGLVNVKATAVATVLTTRMEKAKANVELSLRPVNGARPVVLRFEYSPLEFHPYPRDTWVDLADLGRRLREQDSE